MAAAVGMGTAALSAGGLCRGARWPLPLLFAFVVLGGTALAQEQTVTATGVGRPPARVANAAQGRIMAERAALVRALRDAARLAKRDAPPDYAGPVRVGATVQGFRITRVTHLPDGSVEVEVSVPVSGIIP